MTHNAEGPEPPGVAAEHGSVEALVRRIDRLPVDADGKACGGLIVIIVRVVLDDEHCARSCDNGRNGRA